MEGEEVIIDWETDAGIAEGEDGETLAEAAAWILLLPEY